MKSTFLTALLLAMVSPSVLAEPTFATGAKIPTVADLKKAHKEQGMRKIKKVELTALGLQRANAERAKRGLAPLPASTAVPHGKDTVIDSKEPVLNAAGLDDTGVTVNSVVVSSLPAALDNSILPSFPPIGNQGGLGSCTTWATGYYQHTNNVNLAMGRDSKADPALRCSPKFLYNMINGGYNNGSAPGDALYLMANHGCVNIQDLPYDGDFRAWDLNTDHWEKALPTRLNPVQYIMNLGSATGLGQAKTLLNNGYVLTFITFIYSWQYSTILANPNSTSNPLAGQRVAHWMNGTSGGHMMTVVGYDDNAWVDINGNGTVESAELGVFKIANSWGAGWNGNGFVYVAYDSVRTISTAGGPSSGRQPLVYQEALYHAPAKGSAAAPYTPKFLAKFTLNQALRNQSLVTFGWSTTAYNTPSKSYTPGALLYSGGAYAFDGTTVALDGSFVFDVSDLPIDPAGSNRIYMNIADSSAGSPTLLYDLKIFDVANNVLVNTNAAYPISADGNTKTVALTYGSGPVPTPTPSPTPAPTIEKIAPYVSIVDPVSGSVFARGATVALSANATDNVGVTRVSYLVNKAVVCTATAAPYNCSAKLPTNGKKSVSIQAKAYDAAGNVGSSTIISVKLQ